MGKWDDNGQITDKDIQKMKKREELRKELEKAKELRAQDQGHSMKSM